MIGRRFAWAFAVAALLAAAMPARASGRIDTAHLRRDRLRADACILGAVVIYTDPYIGAHMRHAAIAADIARMCSGPFAIYADDRVLDAAAAARLLRQTIEAGLRGQFHDGGGSEAVHDAR